MKKWLIVGAAFAVVLGINLYFRAFPAYFPQLKKSAAETVLGGKLDEISRSAHQDFANLPASARSRLIQAQYEQYKRTNAKILKQQIAEEYVRQKDRFQDKRGQTYLMELDCWHWARYVDNVVKYGRPWDVRRDGRPVDTLMLSPDGSEMGWSDFLFYSSAALYKVFRLFYDIPLQQFLFYLPLLQVGVFLAFLFFFCYRFYGLVCAFVSCMFIGLAPIFIPRSVAGWFDMDVLTMLLPLVAVVCYLYSFEFSGKRRLQWIFFSSLWMGLFAFTWSFWFVFAMIIAAYEAYTLSNLFSERLQYKTDTAREMWVHCRAFGAFLLLTVVSVLLFCGSAPFRSLHDLVSGGARLNEAVVAVWPKVLSTVGELRRPDIMTIGRSTGDIIVFCIALGFMLMLLLLNRQFRGLKRESAILFTIWFIVMFLISFKGIRFIMFLLIPLGIVLGWGLEEVFSRLERKRHWIGFGACALTLIYISFSCFNVGYKTALGVFPLMNDQWYSLLAKVRQYTPRDSVISSWWDFGDWFKTVGGRPVIFDGQSQEGPRAYWMGQVLLADNETKAVNILRMLNNGGNRVFEIIDNHLHDPFRSLSIVKGLVASSRGVVMERLAGILPAEEAQRVSALIFDAPRHKGYLVVDSSMLLKMPAISFLGNWDVAKAYVSGNIARRSEKDIMQYLGGMGIQAPAAEKLMLEATMVQKEPVSWISSRDYFFGSFASTKVEDGLVFFDNGSSYNPAANKFYLYDVNRRTFRVPFSIFTIDGDKMGETVSPGADETAMSAVIIKKDDKYELMLVTPEIARSLFFRLYYLHGKGYTHFRPFASENDTAAVYEIIW